MAWVQSHQSLSRHRKTLAAATLLKVDRHKLIGHLHELWWWGLDNADSTGFVGPVSHEVLAEAAGWPMPKASAFVSALVTVGFIDLEGDAFQLHDWPDYAGKLQSQKDANRERMRRARASHEPPEPPSTNGTRAEHVQRTNGARAKHVTRTVRERAGLEESREEESREEKSRENLSVSAETPSLRGKARRQTEVTDELCQLMEDEFWEAFGSRQAVRDVIDHAMGHKARLKCSDQRAYLRNWVRDDAEKAAVRRGGRNGLSLVAEPAVRPVCACGVTAHPAEFAQWGKCRECHRKESRGA